MVKNSRIDQDFMKRTNRQLVFSEIYKAKELSRAQIAQLTGISVMSAGRIADELIEKGLLKESESTEQQTVGRPPKILTVATEKLHSVSVIVRSYGVSVGLTNPYGKLVAKKDYAETFEGKTAQEAMDHIGTYLSQFIEEHAHVAMLKTIGVVMPGLIDTEKGVLVFSSHFNWRNVPLVGWLQKQLPGYTIVPENDIKAHALAESRFGAAQGYQNFVLLSIGNGVGAAAVINGEIYRGENNAAGEIGHIILNPSGRMCECGKIGCLQTNVAKWAILQEARSVRANQNIQVKDILLAYEMGEPWARNLLNRVLEFTFVALNLLSNTFAPQAILLGGSLVEENPALKAMIVQKHATQSHAYSSNNYRLDFSALGKNGAIIGGATAAFFHGVHKLVTE